VLCVGLLEAHTPLEQLCRSLGLPRDCVSSREDLELDDRQVRGICDWPTEVDVDADPRLLMLLANTLRRKSRASVRGSAARVPTDAVVCSHLFRPEVAGTSTVWPLVTILGSYEASLLAACDGVTSLSELANRNDARSATSFRNAMGDLYARQMVL
jgi:hypothetical protein